MAKHDTRIRIASGNLSGLLLATPQNNGITKPMGERERIAIFNRIRDRLSGAKILDAFAGSGALGITALSEGADTATFLESNPVAIKTIHENLKKHKLDQNVQILRKIGDLREQYDLIFVDPPYTDPQYGLLVQLIAQLKPQGMLVLSHPKTAQPPAFDELILEFDRSYAAANIKIYTKK